LPTRTGKSRGVSGTILGPRCAGNGRNWQERSDSSAGMRFEGAPGFYQWHLLGPHSGCGTCRTEKSLLHWQQTHPWLLLPRSIYQTVDRASCSMSRGLGGRRDASPHRDGTTRAHQSRQPEAGSRAHRERPCPGGKIRPRRLRLGDVLNTMSIQQPGLAAVHHGGSDGWRLRCLRCFRAQPERERLNPQLVESCDTMAHAGA
jgi:hypothetical protein